MWWPTAAIVKINQQTDQPRATSGKFTCKPALSVCSRLLCACRVPECLCRLPVHTKGRREQRGRVAQEIAVCDAETARRAEACLWCRRFRCRACSGRSEVRVCV